MGFDTSARVYVGIVITLEDLKVWIEENEIDDIESNLSKFQDEKANIYITELRQFNECDSENKQSCFLLHNVYEPLLESEIYGHGTCATQFCAKNLTEFKIDRSGIDKLLFRLHLDPTKFSTQIVLYQSSG
jgi:hypothetical protein